MEKLTISDILCYFKSQRCSGIYERADYSRPFFGSREGNVDVHGGWYDASGDFAKHLSHLVFSHYFSPNQTPAVVWTLAESFIRLKHNSNPDFREHKRRMLEEAIHGADFLCRMQDKEGFFYVRLSDNLSKVPEDRKIIASETFKGESSDKYKAAYRMGAGVSIAALALASTLEDHGDFKNEYYLKKAEKGFTHLKHHNLEYTRDGKENMLDDYCALLAAVELYKAAGKDEYLEAAQKRALSLMNRQTSDEGMKNWWSVDGKGRPYFHAAEAGLPVIALIKYLEIAEDKEEQVKVKTVIRNALQFELDITSKVSNTFGLARQIVKDINTPKKEAFFISHKTETGEWWQGENARLGSLASAARMALSLFDDDPEFCEKLKTYAWNQLNWILGLNPFDACMLDGSGRNNPEYLTAYPNAPGGICNGITAGFDDLHDIALLPEPYDKDFDHNWRWGEQWIPHAAWFLMAVCAVY